MKHKIRLVLFLAFLVFVGVYYGKTLKQNVLGATNSTVNGVLGIGEYISDKFATHLNQASQIEQLKAQNKELEQYKSLYIAHSGKLSRLLSDQNSTAYEPRVHLSRTLSYLEMGDYNRFFIDYKNIDKQKTYGLIYDAKTIGIAKSHLGKALAILQSDSRCTFAVYVGASMAPGIARGDGEHMVVEFIPKWLKIRVGDKVITSGLDGVFFYGVDVGEVIDVSGDDAYQRAVIAPSNDTNIPSFLYVVEKVG